MTAEILRTGDSWYIDAGLHHGPFSTQEDAERGLIVYNDCVVEKKAIKGFGRDPSDTYRFLSNFWIAEVLLDGAMYGSTEAAYQAAKCRDPKDRLQFMNSTPAWAKQLGRRVQIREDWDEVRLPVMTSLIQQKFTTHFDLRSWLILTGSVDIEETNTWHDKFWGRCKGSGRCTCRPQDPTGLNHLGKILMAIRGELQEWNETQGA